MYVESIAYDWISKNLYYTNVGKITVVQYDNPRNKRQIVEQSQLYGLALDPNSGFLFYSSLSRPSKIYRAFLDGTNSTILAQRGLSMPISLAVDYEGKKLFWADAHLYKIQYSDYNGNNLVTLMSSRLIMPVSLTIYKYYLFYVDFHLSNIYKSSKYFSSNPTLLRSNVNNLYQIKVQAPDLQTTIDNHPCSRQNGDCSHFCFAVPSLDPQYKLSRHCGCPFGLKLDPNMMTCIPNAEEQQVNKCLAPSYFKCNNDRCIRRSDVCDGNNDCLDFSDELNCPSKILN